MPFLFKPNNQNIRLLSGSRGVQNFLRDRAEDIVETARKDFLRQVLHTHGVTPPPYAESFVISPNPKGEGFAVGNVDPAALWIEFGAHPGGGDIQVLNYRPLAHGLDAVKQGA